MATTLYVIAKTGGRSTYGITAAEFRIEVTQPKGWMFSYTAPSGANIVAGDPVDTTADPNTGGGVDLSFPVCQAPWKGMVYLGTLSVVNVGGATTALLVKRHSKPENATDACPLFVLCKSPDFSKACMSTSKEPPGCGAPQENDDRTTTDFAASALILNPTAEPPASSVASADTIDLGNSALWVMGEPMPGPSVICTFDGSVLVIGGIEVPVAENKTPGATESESSPAQSDRSAVVRARLESIRAALDASPSAGSLVTVSQDGLGTFVGEMRAQAEKQIEYVRGGGDLKSLPEGPLRAEDSFLGDVANAAKAKEKK